MDTHTDPKKEPISTSNSNVRVKNQSEEQLVYD